MESRTWTTKWTSVGQLMKTSAVVSALHVGSASPLDGPWVDCTTHAAAADLAEDAHAVVSKLICGGEYTSMHPAPRGCITPRPVPHLRPERVCSSGCSTHELALPPCSDMLSVLDGGGATILKSAANFAFAHFVAFNSSPGRCEPMLWADESEDLGCWALALGLRSGLQFARPLHGCFFRSG